MNFEINFIFEDGSKTFWYRDLDLLMYDLKYDLFEYVSKAKFTTIRRIFNYE